MITREEFERYVEVQKSGATNMFDRPVVAVLACLRVEDVKEIQERYGELAAKYS